MANAVSSYAIKRLPLDTVLWTAVVVPIDCTRIRAYRAENDRFKIRTDQNDSSTEKEVGIGILHEIPATTGSFVAAFPTGTTVCFFQASAIVGTAVTEFIR